MALRLKKDVQKASYYVWFLGAQEARGLRGSRVLLPAIPRLVERSNEQEPLKVTLQVSHKGLKIIQGSSKHFIPHSAITCSVQTEDIVACVLLLYNPATRCPLHVHAYRCDSEATAEALNEQLQILINRPENQKRFADLESRLGLDAAAALAAAERSPTAADPTSNRQRIAPKSRSMSPATTNQQLHHHGKGISMLESPVDEGRGGLGPNGVPVSRMSSGRFDIGSDTGTSTRESDCGSDEHNNHQQSTSPAMDGMKVTLFDDLAAELREKLNGNGPPLLLPPRDYDTVHRSKGNLAASELRRCQNQMIVGAGVKGSKQTIVSSRGSSGIGSSDMAPSPERHDGQTSSDEDWTNDHQESEIVMQPPIKRAPVKEIALHKPIAAQPTQYLYPREPPRNEKFTDDEQHHKGHNQQQQQRQSYRPSPPKQPQQPAPNVQQHKLESNSRRSSVTSREEEEVRPILTKNRPNYNPQRFREIFHADEEPEPPLAPKPSRHYIEPSSPADQEDIRKRNPVQRMQSRDYEHEHDETPIKYEKHFARPIMMDRSGREDHHNGGSSSEHHSYIKNGAAREGDKSKYARAESQDRMPVHNSKPQAAKYKPDYYDDPQVKPSTTESDHGTTSSLEKFMMRQQQQGGKSAATPQKPLYKEQSIVNDKEVTYRPDNDEYYFERNPYREQESQPYRESMEKMLKSPVMRYSSFDEPSYVEEERRSGSTRSRPSYDYQSPPTRRYPGESPVRGSRNDEKIMSEMAKLKVSPQDRFRDAKEKFQKMEKVRGHAEPVHYPPPPPQNHHQVGAMPRRSLDGMAKQQQQPPMNGPPMKRDPNDRMIGNMNSLHRTRMSSNGLPPPHQQPPPMRANGSAPRRSHEWSSEEDTDREREHAMMREMHQGQRNGGGGYREVNPGDRFPGLDRQEGGRLAPAKSLGNLVKGYRHSYAEPHNMMSRSGRVGLAAVNPY